MPQKALVALGVVFGLALLALPVPATCAEAAPGHPSASRAGDTILQQDLKLSPDAAAAWPALTLDAALVRALTGSPRLAAFAAEVEVRDFAARQAGLPANPELSVEVENFAGSGEFSGTDGAETTLRLSQRLELGGKRGRRQELGRQELELARREYDLARAEVLAATRNRFLALLTAQRRLAIAEEQVGIAQRTVQAVQERIAAGKTATIEKVRVRPLAAEARLRRDNARQEAHAARVALAATWGSDTVDFTTALDRLEELPPLPQWQEIAVRIGESPELALRQGELRRADRLLALERAGRVPDLTVSLGARSIDETGDHALVAGFSLPLPLFDRNQAGVEAARSRLAKAREEERAAQVRLRAELTEAWRKAQAARSEVDMLRGEILPAAEEGFAAVAYGYQAGKFGLLEMLDAERTLFETKSRYVDTLAAYHRAVSELASLLGGEIPVPPSLVTPTEENRG